MLQTGQHISQAGDPLTRIPVPEVYRQITQADSSLAMQTSQLRRVLEIDPQAYRKNKTGLPYITAGIFHPPVRRTENFAASHILIFDFDHFENRESMEAAFHRLRADPMIHLMYRSPGGLGLKVLARLETPCYDRHLYSSRYKKALYNLSVKYGLTDQADFRTHDVTRACFLCHDPEAWFNPESLPLILDDAMPPVPQDVFSEKEQYSSKAETRSGQSLPADVLIQIRQKLNPDFKPKPKREAYVPPELNSRIEEIRQTLERFGMQIVETAPIQYGKQIRVAAGQHWAEVNVFFGKRGFSVVKTVKTGSNEELASMAHQILYEALCG